MSATLLRLHRWIGLAIGPVVVLFALSGAALVVREALETALEGGARPFRATGPAAPLPEVVEIARAPFPGAEPRGVRVPRRPGEAYRVLLDWRGDRLEVWVDPYARAVIRTRLPARSVLVAVHSLHASLHLGATGSALVAGFGLALSIQSAIGIWLWWPRPPAATAPLGLRIHRAVGAFAVVGSLVLALTGAYLAGREAVAPASPASARASGPDTGLAARLHRGDFAGWAGPAVCVATGLVLPVLVLSGYALAIRR
jgi:uncharacterized iron-regulated membrane protein